MNATDILFEVLSNIKMAPEFRVAGNPDIVYVHSRGWTKYSLEVVGGVIYINGNAREEIDLGDPELEEKLARILVKND